jgi:outer membrane murein-binding lipoprotein Lpp
VKHFIIGALVFSSFFVSGCATRSVAVHEPRATKAEIDAAMHKYVACIARTVPTLDDGISDASTVAAAAFASCHQAWSVMEATEIRGENKAFVSAYLRTMQNHELAFPTTVVLSMRAKERVK